MIGQAYQTPGLAGVFSTFTVNVPQLDAEIDRVKAKSQGVPLQNVFETMQIYLGSLYVNDFNLFGRTFQVIAQADAPFRDRAADITRLKTRNQQGQMVPLGSLVQVREGHGPDRAMRYNGYPAAEINGGAAPGFSSGEAERKMQELSKGLPKGFAAEWTDLPTDSGWQHGRLHLSALHPARVSGARCAVREFSPAACDHPRGAALPALRDCGRVAQGKRQQHLYPDRPDRAGGFGVQERDLDRGVRKAQTRRGRTLAYGGSY
jgi:hypothetical protein